MPPGWRLRVNADEPLQPLPDALPVNAAKVALGEKLFVDKRVVRRQYRRLRNLS